MLRAVVLEGPESSDESLAARARCGERAAFVALVTRYQDRIYRLALRMSRNASDAEEIVQETFLRAHGGIASFHGESRFGTWLYRIAVNQALMLRRAAKRRPTSSIEVLSPEVQDVGLPRSSPSDGADDLLQEKRLTQRAHEALQALDEHQRAAVVLRDLEELSAEEAAAVLGISAEAVRQRAHRGRLKLRDSLRDLLAG